MTGVNTLRHKLRTMDVAIDGVTHLYEDNMTIVNNTSKPESNSNKKGTAFCHHTAKESSAVGGTLTSHIYPIQKTQQTYVN